MNAQKVHQDNIDREAKWEDAVSHVVNTLRDDMNAAEYVVGEDEDVLQELQEDITHLHEKYHRP